MQQFQLRKILAAIFFILILFFTYLIFKKMNIDKPDANLLFLFAGIMFSALFLFLLFFTRTTIIKTVYEKEKHSKKKNFEDIELKEQKLREQMEKHSLAILHDVQNQTDIIKFADSILIKFAHEFSVVQGIAYIRDLNQKSFSTIATYALYNKNDDFVEGIGINGQTAINKKPKLVKDIPENYINVISGLGSSSPSNLLVLPFVYNNKTIALLELAAFDKFPEFIFDVYNEINNSIAEKFYELNK